MIKTNDFIKASNDGVFKGLFGNKKNKDLLEKLLEETFERRKLPKPEKIEVPMITKLKLEIKSSEAYRVYDEFDESIITKLENGNFLVELELPENAWLYGYLLSFGEGLKVLEPIRIKEIIKEKLEKSLNNYEN